LTSGTIAPGSAATNNVSFDAQSVSIDMKGGPSGANDTATAAAAAPKEGSNNDGASGSATPSGTGNSIGMDANSMQQQTLQLQQLQAQLAAMQGMNNFGTAGFNPQLAAMAGMNMNPAMMAMMANFGGANASNANAMATGASSTNSSGPASTNAAAGDDNNKNNSAAPAGSSNGASNGSMPTPNNDNANQSNELMDNLNPSFLAGAAAAASPADAMAGAGAGAGAGQAGMDSMLSRSSLLAAGVGGGVAGMGGMNLAAAAAANPMMAQLMMQQQMQILMQQQQQLQEQMQTANAAGNGNGNNNTDASNDPNANSSANVNGLDASSLAASAAMFGPGGFGIVNPSTAAATGMAAAANQRPTKKARKNASSASAKGSAAAAASSLSAIANATPIGAAGTNPQPKDLKWLTMLGLLKDYQAENGDCIVPRGYAPNPKLASWVAEQRKQYKLMRDGKPSNITPERVAALNEIEFAWNAQEAAWSRHYSDLQAYKAKFGDCLVPLSYTARPQLGLWVKEQRRHYMLLVQGRKSHMTQARIAQLESVGFVWDSHEATWWDRFNDLKAYQAVHGNCMVPTKYQPNPRLGTWVHHQRRQHRKLKNGKTSHMTHERMEALESIGFCWTPRNGKDGAESD